MDNSKISIREAYSIKASEINNFTLNMLANMEKRIVLLTKELEDAKTIIKKIESKKTK